MSHFSVVTVKITDIECLIEALKSIGFTDAEIERHAEAQELIDYRGNKTKYRYADTKDSRFADGDKCHVIIRKQNVGAASNDLGFFIDAEKQECLVFIDDHTRSTSKTGAKNPQVKALGGFGSEAFMQKISKEYAVAALKKQAAAKGKVAHRVDAADGKTTHVFVSA